MLRRKLDPPSTSSSSSSSSSSTHEDNIGGHFFYPNVRPPLPALLPPPLTNLIGTDLFGRQLGRQLIFPPSLIRIKSGTQPPSVGCKMESPLEYLHISSSINVFAHFGANLYAQSVFINKISASELSRKFIKSALLVGSACYYQLCHHSHQWKWF